MTDDLVARLLDSIKVSDAVPAGEVWLTSGCSWTGKQPGPHGEPEWRMAGMCLRLSLPAHGVRSVTGCGPAATIAPRPWSSPGCDYGCPLQHEHHHEVQD